MVTATMADVPAGLVLVPRHMDGVSKPVWDIVHRASGLQVIKDCASRDDARDTSAALGGVDWERDRDALKADNVARAVYLAVQHEVWTAETMRGRKQ